MNTLNKKEILCTLGPASTNDRVIKRLEHLGVSLFRINLSHTKIEDLINTIHYIKDRTSVPICIDTEGAQIRTGILENKRIILTENSIVNILNDSIEGNAKRFNLYPHCIVDQLKIGDLISIDFNSVLVQVTGKNNKGLVVRVITGGLLGQNKAVSIDREILMPALTQKDCEALDISCKVGIKSFALSFANHPKDVDTIRSIVGDEKFIISKIESYKGVQNLEAIAEKSDVLLLDRGDLSREFPVEQIPRIQKEIIARTKKSETKIFIATNLLESMTTALTPTRAEVNDIFNTLNDGADGLVLAAETAIGAYPVQCVMMVKKMIQQFEDFRDSPSPIIRNKQHRKEALLIVEPHGGVLVNRLNVSPDFDKIKTYKRLKIDMTTLLDIEQIAIGTFSPLEGFMTKQQLESVLQTYRLQNGLIWTLPILLQIKRSEAESLNVDDEITLCLDNNNDIYATMHIEDIYSYDLDKIAGETFGTTDRAHPGVQLLQRRGNYFLGGKIKLLKRVPSQYKYFEITPSQARAIFENKGWSRIVGFHTRNAAHRVHEFIQLLAFEKHHCDGIFIHPLVGPKKRGDFNDAIILKSYELIIEKHYPKEKTLLAAFQNYPRYSGPREAIFTALCRKNFGCSHFVVGRDHSGVGGYYERDGAHKLFKHLGGIGIQPIFFNEIHYCKKCKKYTDECIHDEEHILKISGTEGRKMLMRNQAPPEWFMRTDVSHFIMDEMKKGEKVFME